MNAPWWILGQIVFIVGCKRLSPFLCEFRTPDPTLMQRVEEFLDCLKALGVRVGLFLPRHHPELYALLARPDGPYAGGFQAAHWLRDVVTRRGLSLLLSYGPARTGCPAEDFYAGMYARPARTDLLLGAAP